MEFLLAEVTAGRRVCEPACGTGYWTVRVAEHADAVVAFDYSLRMLRRAACATRHLSNVELFAADARCPPLVCGSFGLLVICFWISHVPRQRLRQDMHKLHAILAPGGQVVLVDNVRTACQQGIYVDVADHDTWKLRQTPTGREFRVRKNYYTASEVEREVGACGRALRNYSGRHLWWTFYEPAPTDSASMSS